MSTFVGLNHTFTTVAPKSGTIYGYSPATLQTDLAVDDFAITGTLNYVSTGELASYWGPGNFMALEFTPAAGTNAVQVGLVPSQGSGFATLDSDKDAAAVVTDVEQKFWCVDVVGSKRHAAVYDLSELVLATS